jgi:chromosome segregation ATPase
MSDHLIEEKINTVRAELAHLMSKEQFFRELYANELKDLERLSALELKLSQIDSDLTELKSSSEDETRWNSKLNSFYHTEILPKVGVIVDRAANRTGEAHGRLQDEVRVLDNSTVKKSNLTKYLGAAFSIIFTGGIGSVFAYLFDLQTKLDLVPLLQAHVEELQVKHRESEKTFFTLEGSTATLKARFDAVEENQNKIKAQSSELQQSVQTNSYSITDLLERIAISDDGLDL